MNPILSSHILFFKDDKVLLVRHGEKAGHITGVYGIPGGRQNLGETFAQTAVREFKEETGLDVKEKDLIGFPNNIYTADILRKDGEVKKFTMHVFAIKIATGNLNMTLETIPEWVKMAELKEKNLLPNVLNAILESGKAV